MARVLGEFIPRPKRGDYCDQQGAEILARALKAYWRERGYEIEAVAVEMKFVSAMRSTRWDVRTDLVDGYPKDFS